MSNINLASEWTLSSSKPGFAPVPARVPGDNYSALLDAGGRVCIVDLDAEVAHGGFRLRVPKERPDGADDAPDPSRASRRLRPDARQSAHGHACTR